MSKKKGHAEEHVNHERWLVSYADFITLLFAFFVVLFASSQVDRSKTKKMALAIESAFDRFSIFKEQSGDSVDSGKGSSGAEGNAKKYREYLVHSVESSLIIQPATLEETEFTNEVYKGDPRLNKNTGYITPQEVALARAQKDLMQMISQQKLDSEIKTQVDERGIMIRVNHAILFAAGSNELTESAKKFLYQVGLIIGRIDHAVRVEGHTDDKKPGDDFVNNWDLASRRAIAVIDYFVQELALEQKRFIAVSYGDQRPLESNLTEAGRAQNRRVDIVILSKKAQKKEAPIKVLHPEKQIRPKESYPEIFSDPY